LEIPGSKFTCSKGENSLLENIELHQRWACGEKQMQRSKSRDGDRTVSTFLPPPPPLSENIRIL